MARIESDREDLYEELASAIQRWEFQIPEVLVPVVAGIRHDGRFSIYLSPDECYHFHARHELQRAYLAGDLYRTQGHTLARLRRHRAENRSELLRRDLDAVELTGFLEQVHRRLTEFRELLDQRQLHLLRCNVGDEDPWDCIQRRIDAILSLPLRLAPAYPTKQR